MLSVLWAFWIYCLVSDVHLESPQSFIMTLWFQIFLLFLSLFLFLLAFLPCASYTFYSFSMVLYTVVGFYLFIYLISLLYRFRSVYCHILKFRDFFLNMSSLLISLLKDIHHFYYGGFLISNTSLWFFLRISISTAPTYSCMFLLCPLEPLAY
jgi:hypothetical protein